MRAVEYETCQKGGMFCLNSQELRQRGIWRLYLIKQRLLRFLVFGFQSKRFYNMIPSDATIGHNI